MPLARYFFFVGAALLALLFVADAYLPKPPAADGTIATSAADLPMIRIQSDRKWPERIVFDTSIPAASLTRTAAAAPVQAPARVAQGPATDVSAKVREAFAQLQPQDAPHLQPSVSKTTVAALVPQRHKIAKKHMAPPTVLVAQQQQPRPFGFFANNSW